MSEAEVEAVLGGPAGDYRTRSDIDYISFPISGGHRIPFHPPDTVKKEWRTDQTQLIVTFGPGAGVTSIQQGHGVRPPTWSDILRSRLRDLARLRL